MIQINDLNETEAWALIQTLAAAHPDYSSASDQWPSRLKQPCSAGKQAPLIHEALTILAADPQQAPIIQAILENRERQQFDQNRPKVPTLMALILVLGIQVEFDHKADGSESFHLKYDASNAAVVELLKKLEQFLDKPG